MLEFFSFNSFLKLNSHILINCLALVLITTYGGVLKIISIDVQNSSTFLFSNVVLLLT